MSIKKGLGLKVSLGIGLMFILLLVISGSSFIGQQFITGKMNEYIALSELDMVLNEDIIQPLIEIKANVEQYIYNPTKENINDIDAALKLLNKGIEEYSSLSAGYPELAGDVEALKVHYVKVGKIADAFTSISLVNSLSMKAGEMSEQVSESTDSLMKVFKEKAMEKFLDPRKAVVADEVIKAKSVVNVLNGLLVIIATVVSGLIIFVLYRYAIGPLQRIIDQVSSASGQITSASGQIAGTSQQMAQGANDQASTIEETSSSLEEMSSMIKQTADNAHIVKQQMDGSMLVVNEGTSSMEQLNDAVNEIKKSSDETTKILKSIEDIAFQTNLLALNAAVEAARAGEAGKGFAVVAEEVRNLAQRSSEAVKSTAILIETATRNSDQGVTIASKAAKIFSTIMENTNKINTLISEITVGTGEQARGVEQINIAVSQMNKVTQANAASSEETAASSEELSAQARELDNIVQELVRIVSG